jgi:hypothetical protein
MAAANMVEQNKVFGDKLIPHRMVVKRKTILKYMVIMMMR